MVDKKKEYDFSITALKAGTSLAFFGVPYLVSEGSGWGIFIGAILTGLWNAVKFYYEVKFKK